MLGRLVAWGVWQPERIRKMAWGDQGVAEEEEKCALQLRAEVERARAKRVLEPTHTANYLLALHQPLSRGPDYVGYA